MFGIASTIVPACWPLRSHLPIVPATDSRHSRPGTALFFYWCPSGAVGAGSSKHRVRLLLAGSIAATAICTRPAIVAGVAFLAISAASWTTAPLCVISLTASAHIGSVI